LMKVEPSPAKAGGGFFVFGFGRRCARGGGLAKDQRRRSRLEAECLEPS
jgi:hypothetical protein